MVSTSTAHNGVTAGEVVRPAWQRLRFWVVVALVLVAGGVALTALRVRGGGPLDPSSPAHSGSKVLAVLLDRYGTPVRRTTSIDTALSAGERSTVVVPAPFAYSDAQLTRLAGAAARLVVVRPEPEQLAMLHINLLPEGRESGPTQAYCSAPAATAAGRVDLPEGTTRYEPTLGATDATSCYNGAVIVGKRVSVLGSASLLRNDHVGDEGIAALDINVLSDNGSSDEVVWLVPGADATAVAAPNVWDLFPDGARRAFVWLLPLGVLLMLWRGRRFGPVVSEPLPVVVRSAEVVEGHGRLYRRAGARDRAAAALRTASARRLATHTGLQRAAGLPEIISATAQLAGRPEAEVADLLAGPAPANDHALIVLASQLDAVEAAAGVPPRSKGNHR